MTDVKSIFEVGAAVIASLGTAGGLLIALSTWLGRVWANRILEQDRLRYAREIEAVRREGTEVVERLKGEINKQTFVHKLQFEKEFEIYCELWTKLLGLARAADRVKRLIEIGNPGERQEDRDNALVEAYNDFSHSVFDNRPFYAPAVYDVCKKLLKLSGERLRLARRSEHANEEFWDKIESTAERISAFVEEANDEIRNRIWLEQIP